MKWKFVGQFEKVTGLVTRLSLQVCVSTLYWICLRTFVNISIWTSVMNLCGEDYDLFCLSIMATVWLWLVFNSRLICILLFDLITRICLLLFILVSFRTWDMAPQLRWRIYFCDRSFLPSSLTGRVISPIVLLFRIWLTIRLLCFQKIWHKSDASFIIVNSNQAMPVKCTSKSCSITYGTWLQDHNTCDFFIFFRDTGRD